MTVIDAITPPMSAALSPRMVRVEVRPMAGEVDPLADAVLAQARAAGLAVRSVTTARVYLIQAALSDEQAQRVAGELLADPVNQTAVIGVSPIPADGLTIEVHYQPGVMDPVAQSTKQAIAEMAADAAPMELEVRTGFRYDLVAEQVDALDVFRAPTVAFAKRALANPVIQDIYDQPFFPASFPQGSAYTLNLRHVALCALDDDALVKMSRQAHLFLSLDEMRGMRDYFRAAGREPTDIELESIAQTWSEHCVHKTLKSTMHLPAAGMALPLAGGDASAVAQRPGHTVHADGSLTIDNLLKSTIAAATFKLMEVDAGLRDWCVSVFKDNAGVVKFDDQDAVCIKVETHNHPSAIEPYGGAATGIGGCIRDVMGTGLAARPIANTDVFCVAFAQDGSAGDLPRGVIPPRRALQQIVAGVRDYGNRMGIPTVNGAVYFHHDYLANPLVYCGCVGMLPLDKCFGQAQVGDHIIALGGATGRDGIHGATFSSAELTDTHADEFSHAVQIGNAITQKKTLDVIIQARDWQPPQGDATTPSESSTTSGGPLFHAVTDCGAGGFSSAVGEMGKDTGAVVHLDRAPLKYQGLSYTEIWISEAQERMILAVPEGNLDTLRRLCAAEDVDFCDLGTFGCGSTEQPELSLLYHGQEVGRLSMHFLHDGIPTPVREASWSPITRDAVSTRAGSSATIGPVAGVPAGSDIGGLLTALLAHPNIASKHWIIRQYDHEVQGGSVVKPLTGPGQDGPSDAAVVRPKLGSPRGIALACGLAPALAEKTAGGDSYYAALAAMDECVRNLVCVGADPTRIAVLDNFCWPRCEDPAHLGSLIRAAEGCYDGALAYRTPFVSGKDSLSNQFTTEDGKLITIAPTLLISGLGLVEDVARCVTMDAKAPGNLLLMVGLTTSALGGSHYQQLTADASRDRRIPMVDLAAGPAVARAVADLIASGLVRSAHDCSEGGLLVAAAEMAFAGRIGLDLDIDGLPAERELDDLTACFAETPSRYLLEIEPAALDAVIKALTQARIPVGQVGRFANHDHLTLRCRRHGRLLDVALDALRQAWLKPLDW